MTTVKPTVRVSAEAPSVMARDLGVKFAVDVRSLVIRSLSIMVPTIGQGESIDIVLSVLAGEGLTIEQLANCLPGTFEAIVDAAAEHRRPDG